MQINMLDRCPYIFVCMRENMHIMVSLSSHPFCACSACVCIVQQSDCYSGSDAWLDIGELVVIVHALICVCTPECLPSALKV